MVLVNLGQKISPSQKKSKKDSVRKFRISVIILSSAQVYPLSVIRYLLSVIRYLLSVIRYPLLVMTK